MCLCLRTKTSSRQIRIDKHLRSRKKTQQSQRLSGCKPQSGCFFHPAVYRRGYSLLLPLQITACLADLNIAIKPFPSFCVSHHCAAEASGPIAQGGRCCLIHLPLPLHCSGRNRGLVWRVCVTTAHGKHSLLIPTPRRTLRLDFDFSEHKARLLRLSTKNKNISERSEEEDNTKGEIGSRKTSSHPPRVFIWTGLERASEHLLANPLFLVFPLCFPLDLDVWNCGN